LCEYRDRRRRKKDTRGSFAEYVRREKIIISVNASGAKKRFPPLRLMTGTPVGH
jgi:hypothetical protein